MIAHKRGRERKLKKKKGHHFYPPSQQTQKKKKVWQTIALRTVTNGKTWPIGKQEMTLRATNAGFDTRKAKRALCIGGGETKNKKEGGENRETR